MTEQDSSHHGGLEQRKKMPTLAGFLLPSLESHLRLLDGATHINSGSFCLS